MLEPNITVYGSLTCPDTKKTTEWLDKHELAYEFKDVDASPEYGSYVEGLNNGTKVLPTVQINNQVLFNPNPDVLDATLEKASLDPVGQ